MKILPFLHGGRVRSRRRWFSGWPGIGTRRTPLSQNDLGLVGGKQGHRLEGWVRLSQRYRVLVVSGKTLLKVSIISALIKLNDSYETGQSVFALLSDIQWARSLSA